MGRNIGSRLLTSTYQAPCDVVSEPNEDQKEQIAREEGQHQCLEHILAVAYSGQFCC